MSGRANLFTMIFRGILNDGLGKFLGAFASDGEQRGGGGLTPAMSLIGFGRDLSVGVDLADADFRFSVGETFARYFCGANKRFCITFVLWLLGILRRLFIQRLG